ncbi:glycoside hydrolase family 28 [Lacibacter luteus]|uniref:Glycoside hydrolase family 28 n=1 Tax=Lacibacter luteus TaxID=2508719 RepID=A0A4Q1CE55_9BACT|nr:glycosyl hydrolase family 28 protein [Lacibacter luteus]RXK57742.1 glycoside hydrolase family 28 [Lacibacter luteus]
MKKIVFITAMLLVVEFVFCQQKEFLITAFAAKADGRTNNAKFIQAAIDKAAAAGGGKVIVSRGKFVTGPLVLKSGVELHLQQGAVLLGSTSRMDYGKEAAQALISAVNQNNIAITGKGEIDGRGAELVEDVYRLLKAGKITDAEWKTKRPTEHNRPKLLLFELCNNIRVTGVTIKNGSGWVQDYIRCNNLIIDSITVNSVSYWNNDGIDISNSKNVTITNCYVNAADDAVCLKSDGKEPDSCVNVYIANCKLRSSANAVKFGTSSKGGFRNIVVKNIEVSDTYRSAIALEAVDGGFLENVEVQHIKAINTGNAIFIKLGHRNKDARYSVVRNIHIKDMYVEVPATKPDKGYNMEGPLLRYPPGVFPAKPGEAQSVSPWNHTLNDSTAIIYKHNVFPSSISGLPGHDVESVTLENIEIVYEGGADKQRAYFPWQSLTKITEAETAYPEFSMFGELPAWGLYVRHAKNIQLKNVTLRYKEEDFRVPCIFDDVKELQIQQLTIPQSKEMPVLLLNNVKGYSFKELRLPKPESEAIIVQ